jgi:ABC-type sugar transport system ATPase subunit
VVGLSKSFGGVQALQDVSLAVSAGEVHGLIGSNGAGKSTLIKILSGDIARDAGEIYLEDKPYVVTNPQEAFRAGLNFIHQELALIPKFTILQNLTLGMKKPGRFGFIDWRGARRAVGGVVERVGLKQSLDTIVDTLSVADQWLVSIAHALIHRCRLISMDEPTASLSTEESERLFRVIDDLTRDGVAVLYVSHRLDEILRLCRDISVFKDGRLVLTTQREQVTKQDLIEAIVGGEMRDVSLPAATDLEARPEVLSVNALSAGDKVRQVDFCLHQGEVLGIGGLVGSGRTELAGLIFGINHPDAGEMRLSGQPFSPRQPIDAIVAGIGLVPEERRSQGLILKDSVDFNISLTNLTSLRLAPRLPLVNMKRSAQMTEAIVKRLAIKTPSVYTAVIDLSGGNQQKVVIGKWLNRDLRVLILDEPSRGVDVGARAEIHGKIRELAAEGMGIIVISSDNEELPRVCDRVLVMSFGKIVGELVGSAITKENILYHSCK